MSNQDNGNSSFADGPGALVESGPNGPSTSNSGMQIAMPFGSLGANPANDPVKGGMNGSWLLNSFRRRWLLATSMSLLLSAITAAALYWVLPETFAATASYKVASSPMTLLDRGSSNQTEDFEIFKNTQIASIRNPHVLSAALRDQAINSLPMFDGVDDKVVWLNENLMVTFPNRGELLTISMSGPYPEEHLKSVVEAVSRAYFEEVVFNERGLRRKPLEILQKSIATLERQIRTKLEDYQNLAVEAGTGQAYEGNFDPETKFLLTEASQLQSKQSKLQEQLVTATMHFRIFEKQINDPAYQDSLVDEALQGDPNIAQMQSELMGIEMQVRTLSTTAKGGTSASIRRLLRQKEQLSQQISAMREQMRAQIAGERSNEPNPLLKAKSTEFQITQAMISREIQGIDQAISEIKEKLLEKVTKNTDLMVRISEIEQLRNVEQGVSTKILSLRVELDAPDRISPFGSNASGAAIAETSQSRNKLMRMALSGLGGLGVFGLTCFGISYMEFRNRRLNGPDQVDEGLGIRVIGTLPSLSGRKALNPNHPIVAQLGESVDSVRTTLMHESTSKRRQMVLVTSPATGEGRTTVASQLAASLARAGRRTLLIDGDLRRPALQSLFNTPLEDGLCEVLRAEAEASDVIRPTEAEGLWLMTAGYCDADAVKALATDQVEPIFEKLRTEYDFIIIDGAPVVGLSDSLLFGQHCDGAILSVLRDHSNVPAIHHTAEALKNVGIRIIGAVVNGVTTKADNRVTHLQQVTPKSEQRKLESTEV